MAWPRDTSSFPEPTWWNGGEPPSNERCRDCGHYWEYGPCLCEADIDGEPIELDDLDEMCGDATIKREIDRLIPRAESGEQWAHICALEARLIQQMEGAS